MAATRKPATVAADAPEVEQETAPQEPATVAADAPEVVTVIVAATIGGTRDGVPWPPAGEPVTLPAAEAADYLSLGYVIEADAE